MIEDPSGGAFEKYFVSEDCIHIQIRFWQSVLVLWKKKIFSVQGCWNLLRSGGQDQRCVFGGRGGQRTGILREKPYFEAILVRFKQK